MILDADSNSVFVGGEIESFLVMAIKEYDIEKVIELAEANYYGEGIRDSIIEFCEEMEKNNILIREA